MTKDCQTGGKGLLKAELKRRDLSFDDLAEKLKVVGVEVNGRNVLNKIGRGAFTADFLFQCMDAIGVKTVRLGEGS